MSMQPFIRTEELRQMSFTDAANAWLESHRPFIAPRTFIDYQNHIKLLSQFFSEKRLPEISADDIREFQHLRRARAGGSLINRECSILQQMLKWVGCWGVIQP